MVFLIILAILFCVRSFRVFSSGTDFITYMYILTYIQLLESRSKVFSELVLATSLRTSVSSPKKPFLASDVCFINFFFVQHAMLVSHKKSLLSSLSRESLLTFNSTNNNEVLYVSRHRRLVPCGKRCRW